MRIGCDLDGVLADLHRAFVDGAVRMIPELDPRVIASAEVGASPPEEIGNSTESQATAPPSQEEAATRDLPLDRRQVDVVWKGLCSTSDFWETLAEIEAGTVSRLAQMADQRRWEVIFLTSRPRSAGRTVQRQSQRWLERCGFPLPSVFVVHGSRGHIADSLALDVVIDDRPENCLDVVLESKARAVLVWRGTAASVPSSAKRLGIGVAPTMAACLDILAEADRASDTPRDLMHRLRRLLGLQTKAPSGSEW